MKTVVCQSCSDRRPSWIGDCLETVRNWTAAQGFDYCFIDDALLAYVPEWYRHKAQPHLLLVTDLARLRLIQELLWQGYSRAIWIDADVVVFNPGQFGIDATLSYAFCREVWVSPGPRGQVVCTERVNNAVSLFLQANPFLEFYIHACETIVRDKQPLDRLEVGTYFLTNLHALMPLPLLEQVGLFSPLVMRDIAEGLDPAIAAYMQHSRSPLGAANLCASLQHTHGYGISMDESLYATVIERLLQTQGEVINRFYRET